MSDLLIYLRAKQKETPNVIVFSRPIADAIKMVEEFEKASQLSPKMGLEQET